MKNNSTANKALTIQEVAKRTGMSEYNLRYYERVNLLEGIDRDKSSKHRRYSAADITKIETLACLRALGMPLSQMRRYFELIAQGKQASPKLQELLMKQKQVLEERMEQIKQHVQYVDYKIAYWQAIENDDFKEAEEVVEKITSQMEDYKRCSVANFSVFDEN